MGDTCQMDGMYIASHAPVFSGLVDGYYLDSVGLMIDFSCTGLASIVLLGGLGHIARLKKCMNSLICGSG